MLIRKFLPADSAFLIQPCRHQIQSARHEYKRGEALALSEKLMNCPIVGKARASRKVTAENAVTALIRIRRGKKCEFSQYHHSPSSIRPFLLMSA